MRYREDCEAFAETYGGDRSPEDAKKLFECDKLPSKPLDVIERENKDFTVFCLSVFGIIFIIGCVIVKYCLRGSVW